MKSTGKPIIAGILNIITGVLGIIEAIGVFIGFSLMTSSWTIGRIEISFPFLRSFVENTISDLPILYLIIAILALIGGIFAVLRKLWGLALAGSIVATFLLLPLGIASIVLVSISKEEFE